MFIQFWKISFSQERVVHESQGSIDPLEKSPFESFENH